MAMLTVYFLLLLCSMSPFVHADNHGGACPDDSYCPALSDCSKNSSLCVAGVCNLTAVPSCERGVSVSFSTNSYIVAESIGRAELVLTLDGPIDCCSVSVAVKFEDGTAKGDEDYVTPKDSYVIVKFPAGRTQVSFFVTIIDDEFMEGDESFTISIFDLSVPWGVALGGDVSAEITITDDDGTTVSFRKSTFRVKENEGQVQVELILTVPALFNITVTVTTTNNNLSVSCDEFSAETYTVTFANGTTSEILPINITDDGIYEGDESFTLEIQDGLQDLVSLGTTRTATVVIEEDEEKIIANFEHKMYTVQEHAGSVAPKIMLSKPSPCCFILHAQLMNMTAKGRTVDFGYKPPKTYNYTFNVGSTCASPDANITINDDMVKEDEETFKISIIDYSLPFGVMSGGPAIITINDNDNCISLQYSEQTVSEDEGQIFIRACFEKPPTNDLIIPFNSTNDTAFEGDDYATGPYEVSFKKGERCVFFTISIFNNMVYEGRKSFQVSIDAANLPNGVVPCDPSTVTITILDDELECCFEELSYEVVEGERQDFSITCSRRLPYSITLTLRYQDDTAKSNSDYSIQQRSLRLITGSNETSFYVRTREDSVQEDSKEYFKIELDYNGKPNNTNCDIATVSILDDDDLGCTFEYIQYRRTESSSFTIRLVVSRVPASTFSVILYEEDDTAEGGHDYKLQLYRGIRFIKGGSRYYELKIEPIDDDKVECLEHYSIRIETSALPPRVISLEPTTRIYLQDDDKSIITRDEDKLKFSKEVDCDLEIRVDYYTGSPRSLTVILYAGETEVTLIVSRRIQRITIFICDCLSTSQFIVRASSVYIRK